MPAKADKLWPEHSLSASANGADQQVDTICVACIVSAFLWVQGLDQWDLLCHMLLALWTWEGRWAATGAKEDLVEGKGRAEVGMAGSLEAGEVLEAEAIMTLMLLKISAVYWTMVTCSRSHSAWFFERNSRLICAM